MNGSENFNPLVEFSPIKNSECVGPPLVLHENHYEKLQAVPAEISWTHNVVVLEKSKTLEREFYAESGVHAGPAFFLERFFILFWMKSYALTRGERSSGSLEK